VLEHEQYFIIVCRDVLDEWMTSLGFKCLQSGSNFPQYHSGTHVLNLSFDRGNGPTYPILYVSTGFKARWYVHSYSMTEELGLYGFTPDSWTWVRNRWWQFSTPEDLRHRLTAIRDDVLKPIVLTLWRSPDLHRQEYSKQEQRADRMQLEQRLKDVRTKAREQVRHRQYDDVISGYAGIPSEMLSGLDRKYLRLATSRRT
jgi:hypothetical protein